MTDPQAIAKGLSDPFIDAIVRAVWFIDFACGEGIEVGGIDPIDIYSDLSDAIGVQFDDYGQAAMAVRKILEASHETL